MGNIRELPKDVVEKIAAGEVVERPASVVKELVENSIDAGAKSIVVDVIDGGRKRIAVVDDGVGMDAEDLGRSVLRHATSKIRGEEDLWRIGTMGFRGEALAAIGVVSKLAIESKPNRPDAIEGARVEVTGGAVKSPVAAGCAGGTKIVVADLFFNVPARQKFLRSAAVEFGHVSDAVSALALGNPEIRFELIAEGKRRFLAGAGSRKERVAAVMGEALHDGLFDVKGDAGHISIRGWVAPKGRAGGKDVHVFLNRRPVRDRLLMHAVTAGFGGAVERGGYPAAVLWLDIDPAQVDVNVHPTKREVRFANSGPVHDFVMAAVRKAVGATNASLVVRDSSFETTESTPGERTAGVADALRRYEQSRLEIPRGEGRPRITPNGRERGPGRMDENDSAFSSLVPRPSSFGSLRLLGQLGLTYIVCEGDDGTLVIIDQHAAHERLGFDALKSQYARGKVAQQRKLIPERVELGVKESAYVGEHLELLAKAGFEVEQFGGASLIVKAVPEILGDASAAPLFTELASELEELGSSHTIDDTVEKIFAVVACHAQVRAGARLTMDELESLVRDIEREDVTRCPHGRPAIVRIEKTEIEKWFKRRQ